MLLYLRVVAIVGQSLTIALVCRWWHLPLPLGAMAAAIAVLALAAVLSALRLRVSMPVVQEEIALQLLIDVAQLTALLYLSGGTTNPFASLYLLPMAFAAVALSWRYAAAVALITLGGYGWLDFSARALPLAQVSPAQAFDLHMIGMRVTFTVCAVLLVTALAVMAREMRRRERAMGALREQAMRNEHLHAMGLLAAGAAHELSTPLFSMGMLVTELRLARGNGPQFDEDLNLLEKQVRLCKQRLTTLLRAVRSAAAPARRHARAREVLEEVIGQWKVVRPEVRLEVDWTPLAPEMLLEVDEGFAQAVTSLLHNAADASAARGSGYVRISCAQQARELIIHIDDEGSGLSPEALRQAGQAVFTTKPTGFGLGLVLSHANLNRLNGRITLNRRPEGGTRTTVLMPAVRVAAHAPA
jgi:two-component system sensor histidine kinase RegB